MSVAEAEPITVLPSGMVSRADFARYVGRPESTIAQWAWKKRGPKPVKIQGRAYYRFEEVKRFAVGDWADERAA